ncbi:MAG: PHB depolymerase family esterase [Flavobacteriales bacterium]|nr:PHB depolymerase family esterase [Flavobacteriales bacterium]
MKRSLVLVLFIPLCVALLAAGKGLPEVKDFGEDPGNLRMFVHVPDAPGPSKRPLVVVLHGCTQKAARIADLSGWNKVADQCGAYVVYAQQRPINNSLRCFNWFRPEDIAPEGGEVASIISMVDHALANWPIDPERVFIYGVSSGGALAAAVIACHPERFQGAAIFAGAPFKAARHTLDARMIIRDPRSEPAAAWGSLVTDLYPDEKRSYPPVLVLHGTADNVMDPGHGEALVKQWTRVHGLDTIPTQIERPYKGAELVERRTYADAEGNVLVQHYVFHGIGHTLPIDPGPAPDQGGRTTWVSVDVDLHSTFEVAEQFGLIIDR